MTGLSCLLLLALGKPQDIGSELRELVAIVPAKVQTSIASDATELQELFINERGIQVVDHQSVYAGVRVVSHHVLWRDVKNVIFNANPQLMGGGMPHANFIEIDLKSAKGKVEESIFSLGKWAKSARDSCFFLVDAKNRDKVAFGREVAGLIRRFTKDLLRLRVFFLGALAPQERRAFIEYARAKLIES